MYRVMLIDDENAARKLMLSSFDWGSLGMEVVGEAASGIEAINVIDDMKPDIAFVDIAMPFMNGIEFTEVATKRYPDLVIIIMTAYDDFDYARRCVSLPVFEYMLKPMVRNEVLEVLQRVKNRLDEREAQKAAEKAQNPGISGSDSDEPTEDIYSEVSATDQIVKFIGEHYTDPRLNLTSVAQHFGFSSSYLSRKFKQDTGKNFIEYLTDCRMQKAAQLAEKGIKMYRASEEVGIPDPNYFGKCFKKYTGVSYSEYGKDTGKVKVKKIFLDMDGVLADFDRGVIELCGLEPLEQGISGPREELMWGRIRDVGHFYDKLEPIPGAKDIFDRLYGKYGDAVEILTGIPKPKRGITGASEDKVSWVRRILSKDVKINLVLRENKPQYCTGKDCILIDDYTKNIREWENGGGTGILFVNADQTVKKLEEMGIL